MAKKRILIVHNYYQIPGGEDTVVANEKKLLEEHGHHVVLYTRHNSELKTMSRFQKLMLPLTTIYNPATAKAVKQIIREEKIDVVHVHNTLNLISPSVYYAALGCGVPVVQTMHNFRLLCPGATFYRDGKICEECLEKGLLCGVKHGCYRGSKLQTLACVISTVFHRMTGIHGKLHYICLTEFNKEKLLLLNKPGRRTVIPPENIHIKPNFTFDAPQQKKDGLGEYYLYIGRVEAIKGLDILLRAFAKMPEKKLLIAGSGLELEKYRAAAGGNVTFLGYLDRKKLTEFLVGARALLVASQWYETFGMIVVEAYAAGKPVIVGDIGNVADLVQEGCTGLKFRYDSPEALCDAIADFETKDGAAMGQAGYRLFLQRYSPESNYQLLIHIYEKITNEVGG